METNIMVTSGMQLKKMIEKKVKPVMEEYGLRPVELEILVFLSREHAIDTAKEIIQRTPFSKAHISKSLDNLRTKGFISLNEDEHDHRILHIHLAEKSEEAVKRVSRIYEECREIMQRGISQEDLEIVKKVILKMNENINRELEISK